MPIAGRDAEQCDMRMETAIGRFVPYSTHVSPSIVKSTGGDYLLTWRLEGLPFVGREEWEHPASPRDFQPIIADAESAGFHEPRLLGT